MIRKVIYLKRTYVIRECCCMEVNASKDKMCLTLVMSGLF